MKSNKKGDSIAGIIIAIFILSFILIGSINILNYNKDIVSNFKLLTGKYILSSNANNITKNIDTSNIKKDEIFYVKKDKLTKSYEVFTGTINENYKYFDVQGNNIDPEVYKKEFFEIYFKKNVDILRHFLAPSEIKNNILHFDGFDINGDGITGNGYNDNQSIYTWIEKAKGNNANAGTAPIYSSFGIKSNSGVLFDGNNYLSINENSDINLSNFNEKSFAIIFKTGNDISSIQNIYKQGNINKGYAIQIKNGKIYGGTWNTVDWSSGNQIKSIGIDIIKNTVYSLIIVHNSNSNNPDNKKLEVYLNGYLVGELTNVGEQTSHNGPIVIGASDGGARDISSGSSLGSGLNSYFGGVIGEIISWNHSLTKNEISGVQNYFDQKWLGGKSNIKYYSINTFIE